MRDGIVVADHGHGFGAIKTVIGSVFLNEERTPAILKTGIPAIRHLVDQTRANQSGRAGLRFDPKRFKDLADNFCKWEGLRLAGLWCIEDDARRPRSNGPCHRGSSFATVVLVELRNKRRRQHRVADVRSETEQQPFANGIEGRRKGLLGS